MTVSPTAQGTIDDPSLSLPADDWHRGDPAGSALASAARRSPCGKHGLPSNTMALITSDCAELGWAAHAGHRQAGHAARAAAGRGQGLYCARDGWSVLHSPCIKYGLPSNMMTLITSGCVQPGRLDIHDEARRAELSTTADGHPSGPVELGWFGPQHRPHWANAANMDCPPT